MQENHERSFDDQELSDGGLLVLDERRCPYG
jgi:hypothetical protein